MFFAYCAIFLKDYELKEEELMLPWMAESLFQQSTYIKQLKGFGEELLQAFSIIGDSLLGRFDRVGALGTYQ
ncbi:hypothetical protein Ddye_029411 [Dipteronia dyeriana]|uniref:Uncharacterized protein n=1 Tax=Dipteronia dyeriana TaxID=168575 RepID=A0AAD9WKJ8_9ROSI|nr:hypothetical protein Ddye_029411 [Dipteronia dyeriana]